MKSNLNFGIKGLELMSNREAKETNGGIIMIIASAAGIYSGICALALGAGYAYEKLTNAYNKLAK